MSEAHLQNGLGDSGDSRDISGIWVAALGSIIDTPDGL